MNNQWVKYSIYLIFIILLQGLVVNQFQVSKYVYPMIYVVSILMLPFTTSSTIVIILSLIIGVCIDALSDTFGLHTSAILVVGYLRPIVLELIKPRDGYDNVLLPTIHDMGKFWFFRYVFVITFIHHLWFFTFELFRFDLIGIILIKTILSSFVSLMLIILLQYLFYKPTKQ